MADSTEIYEALYEKSTTTSRLSGKLWIQKPSTSTTSGYEDYQIDASTLMLDEQTNIAANQVSISSLYSRTTALEELLTKTREASQNADYTFTQAADSKLMSFLFIVTSGTPTVSVGTTDGGDDIVSSREIDGDWRGANASNYYTATERTIYVTITDGTVDVVREEKLNYNT